MDGNRTGPGRSRTDVVRTRISRQPERMKISRDSLLNEVNEPVIDDVIADRPLRDREIASAF